MHIINTITPVVLTTLSLLSAVSATPFPASSSASTTAVSSCGLPTDLLVVSSLSVSPDPPKKGQEVTLEAVGVLGEDVGVGAVMK
ncbi:hypothetical protein HDU67_008927, partial [Dinochytrium kinnereticum]